MLEERITLGSDDVWRREPPSGDHNAARARRLAVVLVLSLGALGAWVGLYGGAFEEFLFVAGPIDRGMRWCKAFWVWALLCAWSDVASGSRQSAGLLTTIKVLAFLAVVGWALLDIGSVRDPDGLP